MVLSERLGSVRNEKYVNPLGMIAAGTVLLMVALPSKSYGKSGGGMNDENLRNQQDYELLADLLEHRDKNIDYIKIQLY